MWPFKRKRARFIKLNDQVWISGDAKEVAIVREIEAEFRSGMGVLVVSPFSDPAISICEAIEQAGLPLQRAERPWESRDTERLLQRPGESVSVVPTLSLPEEFPDGSLGAADEDLPEIFVIVIERHPLREDDEHVERFVESLPCRSRLRFHLALDDGLLQVFARDWLVPLMKNLGLTDDRCIESGMLTRRIRAAQKEFPSRTNTDPVAASSHEWIERHDAQPK